MASYTALYHNTFHDKKFKQLHVEAKLLFIYLLANGGVNLTGIYDLDADVAKLLVGGTRSFDANIQELVENNMVRWDPATGTVWVINRFKWLVVKNSKVVAGAMNELREMTHPFKQEFVKRYKSALQPYIFKLEEYPVTEKQALDEDFIINASKIYNSKKSIKNFLETKGINSEKIDSVLERVLPNLK